MRWSPLFAVVLLALAAAASAHTYNHGDKHEECQADLPPSGHFVGDGHAHTHDPAVVAADPKEFHPHNPCNQLGMQRPSFPDASPLTRTYYEEAVINTKNLTQWPVILDTEALLSDVTEYITHRDFIAIGDGQLAALARDGHITGRGTPEDPYIIENKLIRNVMWIKDTSACIVIRDNIIHSRALLGPLIGPEDVLDLVEEATGLEVAIGDTQVAIDVESAAAEPDDELIAALEQEKAAREDELAAVEEEMAAGIYQGGGHAADTMHHLAHKVAQEVRDQLQRLAGRLILDWNGQCVHVYNNIVEDLRVNRNNMRTGYATGGIIEDNRLFHIGQIRHYDGEFRENVVGYRDHLWGWLPNITEFRPLIWTWLAMNTDGFNQGWFHDNLIFGAVDLDFHGHHHGAGFYAPKSHYHGSDRRVAYMYDKSTGGCVAPAWDYGAEDSVFKNVTHTVDELLGQTEERCIAHHDHRKRWTSAVFEDNTVIDPFGYGIRYEDRNHAGDDRIAASEDMEELNVPHVHRTHIELRNNVVLGSMWVDVFNSPTVDVWSDDFSEVKYDAQNAIVDAAKHLGAKVISSHPERNTGWLTIEENVVYTLDKHHNTPGFHYGWAAYQINDARQIEALEFRGNQAYFIPYGFGPDDATDDAFIAEMEAGRTRDPDATAAEVSTWGTPREGGPMSYAIVFHHFRDTAATACDNHVRGYDVGLFAYWYIFEDATVTACDNTYGQAAYPEVMRTTPYSDLDRGPISQLLHNLSDDTSLEPLMRPYVDWTAAQERTIDKWMDDVEAWRANTERQAEWEVAKLQNGIHWWLAQQMWALDRQIYNINNWLDHQNWYVQNTANSGLHHAQTEVGNWQNWAGIQAWHASQTAEGQANNIAYAADGTVRWMGLLAWQAQGFVGQYT